MKTVLVVSSDAGGTMALLPVVRELLARQLHVRIVGSGPAIRIWRDEPSFCRCDPLEDDICEEGAMGFIQEIRPDALLSGAGAYNRIEHTFRRAASRLDLFSFALVDGWFNFTPRFSRERNGTIALSLPDLIGVMDAASYQEMVEEGFAPDRLVVVGAPHIEETVQYVTSATAREVGLLRDRFGLQGNLPTFVFFSAEVVEGDRLGRGQTQVTILREVIQALEDACGQCSKRVRLVVKPHPSEDAAPLSQALQHTSTSGLLACRMVENCRSWELICLADAVLGIASTTLLEAALCRKPALSLQLGRDVSVYPDRHFANLPGVTPVYDSTHCLLAIQQLVCQAPKPGADRPTRAGGQAACRLVQTLLEHLSKVEAGTPVRGDRTGS